MSGKCVECGKETDNFIEYSDWFRETFQPEEDGYWKCPECVTYCRALREWENEQFGKDDITCPWCGYEFGDSWEYDDEDDACECTECGKLFAYERNVKVTYTSKRRECDFDYKAVSA